MCLRHASVCKLCSFEREPMPSAACVGYGACLEYLPLCTVHAVGIYLLCVIVSSALPDCVKRKSV